MTVDFRLLGDVEVRIDDRLVDVGHTRQRCVLVALVLDANRPVPADALLDRVWADRLPQRARGALASYLSRLRRVLAPAVTIRHQPGGYRLAADPMTVDVHRFHHLVADARAAEESGLAESTLSRALELWRGEAWAGLDTPWLCRVRTGLEAERLSAELDYTDLALDAGRHAELLGRLAALAEASPLDERLAGQYLLALYRSGRQAEALHRYDRIRRRLVEELGTDPGVRLRQLHRRMLRADPALLAAGRPTVAAMPRQPPATPVPRQLPAPPPAFVGRARELAALEAAGEPVVVVSGTAGVGKTALVLHWSHAATDRFPDGQLYLGLRGFDPAGSALHPAEAMRMCLDALGIAPARIPAELDARAALYRSALAGRRVLVVLDDARDADQVRPLLPGDPGCTAVVTSRDGLSGLVARDGARPIVLDLLPAPDAARMLGRRLGEHRIAAEPAAAAEIVTRCARLPLALAVVAARVASRPEFPLTWFAAELSRSPDGLGALADGDPAVDVRSVFAPSYGSVSPPARYLFRLLGLHPGVDATPAVAASLVDVASAQVRPILAELTRARLIDEYRPGRYTTHDLLRAYAGELARDETTEPDRKGAWGRLIDHYLHTAYAADRLLYPHRADIPLGLASPRAVVEQVRGHDEALAWFTTERRNLLAVMDSAATAGFHRECWQLSWVLTNFLNLRGYWHDQLAVQGLALSAALRLADRSARAHAHRCLGRTHDMCRHDEEAASHLRQALDLYAEIGDRGGTATAHLNTARMFERQGDIVQSLWHDRQALELFDQEGDRAGLARTWNNIGWGSARLGELTEALKCCRRALALHRQLGNRHGEATAWDSIGYIEYHRGNPARAVDCYQRALQLHRAAGDRPSEAEVLLHLGDAFQLAGDDEPAGRSRQRAMEILDDIDPVAAEQVRSAARADDHAVGIRATPHR